MKAILNSNKGAGRHETTMYVCICVAVSEKEIRDLVGNGACTAVEVMTKTGAGSRCGTCRSTVVAMVEGSSGEEPRPEPTEESVCGVRRLRMIRRASSAA